MDRSLDLLPAMPFNDVNDFLDFDESLASNENVQDQFVNISFHFSTIDFHTVNSQFCISNANYLFSSL